MKAKPINNLYSLSFIVLMIFFTACGGSKKVARTSGGTERAERREKHTERNSEAEQVAKVIKTARSYVGTPYKWGGTTRAGIDCSGLLVCSFKAANINLPRTSSEQSSYGKKVSIYELQPGDLVFFAAKKGRGKISHVGLVTEVRGKNEVIFIHASSKLGVVENNLYSDYYRRIFVKAQRPF